MLWWFVPFISEGRETLEIHPVCYKHILTELLARLRIWVCLYKNNDCGDFFFVDAIPSSPLLFIWLSCLFFTLSLSPVSLPYWSNGKDNSIFKPWRHITNLHSSKCSWVFCSMLGLTSELCHQAVSILSDSKDPCLCLSSAAFIQELLETVVATAHCRSGCKQHFT